MVSYTENKNEKDYNMIKLHTLMCTLVTAELTDPLGKDDPN
jgi:hypothetical protein